jgi:hypothetical protein
LADLIVSQPTLDTIASYQISSGLQYRLDYLLEKNGDEGLAAEEKLELEKILTVVDVMNLAKVRAKLKLAGKA